jgi:hypothetical protein
MAHFDIIPVLIQAALKKENRWLYEKIERDWNKKLTIPEAR